MAEVPRYVVDASAALKWLFHDEPGGQEATDLVTDFVGGRISLVGPYQLQFEVTTAIRRRVLLGQITQAKGEDYLTAFLALRIPTVHPDGLVRTSYDYSFRYGLSLYDSLYVSLAQISESTLITGDEALLRALTGRFKRILWIEDYPQ